MFEYFQVQELLLNGYRHILYLFLIISNALNISSYVWNYMFNGLNKLERTKSLIIYYEGYYV